MERECGAFKLFQAHAGSSGKASLVTDKLRLPAGTWLKDLSIDTSDPAKCPFQYSMDTLDEVVKNAGAFNATHYAVVVGPDIITPGSVNVGCREGSILFVPSNIGSGTIIHEMGHVIGGLHDEYGGNNPYTGSAFTDRNCSTDKTAFSQITGSNGKEPCDRFKTGIYRPTENCRMQTASSGTFCQVCSRFIQRALEAPALLRRTPPSSAPSAAWEAAHRAEKGLEVVATLDRNRALRVVRVVDASKDMILPQVITGEWFAVAFDGDGNPLAVAPLPSDDGELPAGNMFPLDERSPERAFQPRAFLVRFTLVGLDVTGVSGRKLELRLVRVKIARRDLFVTNEIVDQVKEPALTKKKFGLQDPLEDYLRRTSILRSAKT